MNYEELKAKLKLYYRVDDNQVDGVLFNCVQFLLDNVSENTIDAGLYYNHRSNSEKNMVESYKTMLWTAYEETQGRPYEPVQETVIGISMQVEGCPYKIGPF